MDQRTCLQSEIPTYTRKDKQALIDHKTRITNDHNFFNIFTYLLNTTYSSYYYTRLIED